jgi:hypothetical protein
VRNRRQVHHYHHEHTALQRDAGTRQSALELIITKETKLPQTIDQRKLTATDTNRTQRTLLMLQFMSSPKQWQMSYGGVKNAQTPSISLVCRDARVRS